MVIAFLGKKDQLTCLRVNHLWRSLACTHIFKNVLASPHYNRHSCRNTTALLDDPLTLIALTRNAQYIQYLYSGSPSPLSLLAEANCAKFVSLKCDVQSLTFAQHVTLGAFIRKNSSLVEVVLQNVSHRLDLQVIAGALQSCRCLRRIHVDLYLYSNNGRINK